MEECESFSYSNLPVSYVGTRKYDFLLNISVISLSPSMSHPGAYLVAFGGPTPVYSLYSSWSGVMLSEPEKEKLD